LTPLRFRAVPAVVACILSLGTASGQVLQGFHPDRQEPLKLVTPEYTAEIIPRPRDPNTGESRSIFRLTREGRESSVTLPLQFYQVNSFIQGTRGKLIVVGMSGGSAYEVGVVDVAARRLEDRFRCYSPSVSPDGQYVVFTKFFAPHGIPSPDDHTMLYFVARSASENRPSGAGLGDEIDVGSPLYPAGIGNREADNVDVPPTEGHVLVSYYVWQGPDDVFFADNCAGQIRVVWAQIKRGTAAVRDLVAPPQQIEAAKQYLTRQGFLSLKPAGDSLQLVINSNPKHPLVVSVGLGNFEAAGTPRGN
jgi:hypothetical protein